MFSWKEVPVNLCKSCHYVYGHLMSQYVSELPYVLMSFEIIAVLKLSFYVQKPAQEMQCYENCSFLCHMLWYSFETLNNFRIWFYYLRYKEINSRWMKKHCFIKRNRSYPTLAKEQNRCFDASRYATSNESCNHVFVTVIFMQYT